MTTNVISQKSADLINTNDCTDTVTIQYMTTIIISNESADLRTSAIDWDVFKPDISNLGIFDKFSKKTQIVFTFYLEIGNLIIVTNKAPLEYRYHSLSKNSLIRQVRIHINIRVKDKVLIP